MANEELLEEEDEGVQATIIEAPGIIIDTFTGRKWAVPTDQFDDNVKPHYSPFDFKKDSTFYYQGCRLDEIGEMESRGFVKVTRKEMGSDYVGGGDNAIPMSKEFHTVGNDMVIMKTPKVLADRIFASQKRMCDAALEATQPPHAVTEGVDEDGKSANDRVRSDPLSDLDMDRITTDKLQEALRR